MAKDITITEVLELLEEGKTRPQIAEHFGISMPACRKLFKHDKLKGRKAKKAEADYGFNLVDDTQEEENLVSEQEIVAESSSEQENAVTQDPALTEEVAESASNWEN